MSTLTRRTPSGGTVEWPAKIDDAERACGRVCFSGLSGGKIANAAKEAVELAAEFGMSVELRFNGIDVLCDQWSDPAKVAATYFEIIKVANQNLTDVKRKRLYALFAKTVEEGSADDVKLYIPFLVAALAWSLDAVDKCDGEGNDGKETV